MNYTLYHYVHCPYCIRVRLVLGLLKIPYKSIVLAYDDEKTPLSLTGKKMLPILQYANQSMNESLDIIQLLDSQNTLGVKEFICSSDFPKFDILLNEVAGPVHSLAMPYWIWTPEFTESSRQYFQKKKEEKRGPFKILVQRRDEFAGLLTPFFEMISNRLKPFYESYHLSIKDILLASHLWGLYIVPEFQFPTEIHNWLQTIKTQCNFNYHDDFWSKK